MSEALRPRIVRTVSAVLGVPVDRIDDDTSPDTVTTWDSMLHLQLVLALEQEFGLQFEVEEIEAMQRVGVIAALLEARLAQR
jgi:acyl carrier protein